MWNALVDLMGAQRLLRETWHSSRMAPAVEVAGQSRRHTRTVQICDTAVALEVEEFAPGGPVYVSLHEDEQTSVAAARSVLEVGAGRLVRLRSKGRRYVVFWDGHRPHAFDPNRIFTEAGVRQTLSRYASLTDGALDALCRLRDEVLGLLRAPPGQPVVALHNNSGSDYSVLEYRAEGRHAGDAAAVCISPRQAPEDFFVVTDTDWFGHLERLGFNVVLQSRNAFDDGSLSIRFQRDQRTYINVEARHRRQSEQEAMLRAVADGLTR